MSRSHQDKGMSAEELKQQMYQSLQSAGVLHQMKGFLRQSMINQLKGKHTQTDSDLLAATIKRNEPSWVQRSLDNLIFRHLKQSRYHYALSLFQQESGIMDYDESITEELLQHLGATPDLLSSTNDKENDSHAAPPNSSTPLGTGSKKSRDSQLVLWKILSRISSIPHLTANLHKDDLLKPKTSQEIRKTMTLADKLQAIDEEMDATVHERRRGDIEYRKSISTLAGATRRAEEAAEKRAKESLEQWKKLELAKVKINEAERTRVMIAEKTKQLEDEFAQRKEALLHREQNAIERLNNQKELLEKDLHQQRQLLLGEIEQIRMREKGLQNKEELMREMEVVKLKELDLLKAEASQHHLPVHEERLRRDSVMSSCAESLRKSLTGQESKQFEEVLKELRSRTDQVDLLKQELMSLREEFIQSKNQSPYASKASRSLPKDPGMSEYRKEESSSLRRRLDDLSSQLNEWKKQERQTREERIEEEIGRWKTEVTKLSAARDQLDEKQCQLEDMTLRLQQKMSSSAEHHHNDPGKHLSASNLRVLMDPPAKKKVMNLLEDYEPVAAGRVRWADRMPHTVIEKESRLVQRTTFDSSDSSNLDDSNSTTTSYNSSRDVSTSGIRLDIQRKFKTLEKESDELEEMYTRYIRSNYKHVSSVIPAARPRSPVSSYSTKYSKGRRSPRHGPVVGGTSGAVSDPRISPNKASSRDVQQFGLPLKSRKQQSTFPTRDPVPVLPEYVPRSRKAEAEKVSWDEQEKSQQSPLMDSQVNPNQNVQENANSSSHLSMSGPDQENKEEDKDHVDKSVQEEESQDALHLSSLKSRDVLPSSKESSFSRESRHLEDKDPGYHDLGSSYKPVPTKRQSSLSPRSSKSASLPPISSKSNENLGLGSSSRFGVLPSLEKTCTPAGDDTWATTNTRKIVVGKVKDEDSFSDPSEEVPLKLSSLQAPKNPPVSMQATENPPEVLSEAAKSERESPFQRPELLSRKVSEMQRSLDQSDDQDSPKRDDKPHLSLEGLSDNENLDNILHSIDVNSARDIEDETNPKLTDLLIQLEPNREIHQEKEDDLAKEAEEESKESESEEGISERSSKEYSANFLSSTSSKTASEIKTMSDFEPSSTSIPRIEDKIGSHHQSDEEDKSEADVNWSNLQLDKSGEQLQSEMTQDAPRARAEMKEEEDEYAKKDVDIFEDSASSHSLEAPSDGNEKGTHSGYEDEFW